MSYDIYCYRSKLGVPDEVEAYSIIDTIDAEGENLFEGAKNPALKVAIAKALAACNPKLEVYGISSSETGDEDDQIEIEHPEEDFNLQIFVHDNYVSFNIPYLYQGRKAEEIFDYLKAYVRVIRETAGYFVCDPQTGLVFDPLEKDFNGLDKYLSVSENMDKLTSAVNVRQSKKKPWWKIW